MPELKEAAARYLDETEKVFDWANGCDLSADIKDHDPAGFVRLCQAMVDLRAALQNDSQEGRKCGE